MVGTCDVVPADGCCGVIPCRLCLEWETYTGIEYGSADFATSSWTGTVGGNAFVSYWQRNEAGECEYIVTFGGYEVYRATCYDGASCRNPSGEVEATVGIETGTLRWSVYEPRELELIDNPETGCRDFFCGSCRCSCECVCVTITEYGGDVITGELCDVAYDCDPPVWAGAVGYYEMSIALGRDQYGECIITATVDGDELEPVSAGGCGSMSATITTPGGDVIQVDCKRCSCEQATPEDICVPCPPGTVYPWLVTVTFPSLGVSEFAANELDPEEDGETTFLYRVEGTYGGYNFMCTFGDCDASVVIYQDDPLVDICLGGGGAGNGVSMEAVECPGDTLTLIYTITCENGSTLTVVISG